MDSILFSKSVCSFVVGLEKWSKDLEFENFYGISSLLDFQFAARALLKLPSSLPNQLVLLLVVQEKEYMKLDVGKVNDHMTRGSYIPIDSVKSGDDCFSLFIELGLGHILNRIRSI